MSRYSLRLRIVAAVIACALAPGVVLGAEDNENDNACTMIASGSKMGVDHAELVPLLPHCRKSARCAATRQAMIVAGRTDAGMLVCDQAAAMPQPAPSVSREDADRACAMLSVYAKMGVKDDALKPLVLPCNSNPDPQAICKAILIFNLAKRENPGLVAAGCKYQ